MTATLAFPAPTPAGLPAWRLLPPRLLLAAVVLLLPLKFGSVVVAGEVPVFPGSGWEWLLGAWPSFLAPAVAGGCLLVAVLLLPAPRVDRRYWLFPAAWLLLAAALLPGFARTTEWDAALLAGWHWWGVAAFALAVFWVWAWDAALDAWLLGALAAGTLLAALAGWQQMCGGFAETQAYAAEMASRAGRELPPEFLNRLSQRRAMGTFVYPNSYAAHLILTLPVLLLAAWRAGGRFEPARVSRGLFVGGAAVVAGLALWWSESRAGMLALGGGLALGLWLFPLPRLRRWRWVLAGAVVLVALAGVLGVGALRGRALESVGARLDYWRAAEQMVARHPWSGVGLGEFFPWYMKLKPAGAEETRQPHAMVLGLAAQAGVGAAVAGLACVLLPLCLRHRDHPDVWRTACIQAGLLAWGLHAQADFNSEIPGTVMLVAALPFLALSRPAVTPPAPPAAWRPALVRTAAGLAALVALGAAWRVPGELGYMRLASLLQERDTVPVDLACTAARDVGRKLPFSPYPWAALGRELDARGVTAGAAAAWRETVLRTPHRAAFQVHVGMAALAAGDRPAAAAALAAAREWYPESPGVKELAECLSPPSP